MEMKYRVVDVDDPQGMETDIEAATAQGAAAMWGLTASYPDESEYSRQGYAVVRVMDAGGLDMGTFRAWLFESDPESTD